MLLVAGCHYDQRGLDFDGPPETDGDGGGTTGADSDIRPHAVIASANAVTGVLGVPGQGDFALNGASSYTDDGTAIVAYAWTSDCLTIADPTLAAFTIDGSSVADGCAVTLTVTSADGATDSATITIEHRSVGGYISQALPCQATYDAAFATAQGTQENPWCSIDAALGALADNAIADFRFDASTFTIQKTYALPAARYLGGYVRSGSAWAAGGGSTSAIVGDTDDPSATLIALSNPGAYVFRDFVISRTKKCDADCVTVEVRGADVTMTGVTIRRVGNVSSVSANPSPGSVIALAVVDTNGATKLAGSNLDIASDAADVSAAVVIRGSATVHLTSSAIEAGTGGRYAYGIRAMDGARITVDGTAPASSITVDDDSSLSAVTGFAIAAGRSKLINSNDDCDGDQFCDEAASVSITGADLSVAHVNYASALTVVGPSAIAVVGSSCIARGGSADAVRTIGVGSFSATEVAATATYAQAGSTAAQYAHGYTDGLIDAVLGQPRYGAASIAITGGVGPRRAIAPWPAISSACNCSVP